MRSRIAMGRRAVAAAAFVVGSGPVVLLAQEPAAPAAPVTAAAAPLGTLRSDQKVRCWPTSNSPFFDDSLAKGTAVALGRSEGDYRQVLLPLGPVGYVHKDFATVGEDGKALSKKGTKVAFRAEPKSGRAPVDLLDEGSELWVVGEEGAWWRVRRPGQECWLPAAELEVFEQPPPTLIQAAAELAKVHRGEVEARLDALRQRAEAQRLEAERREALRALEGVLAAELRQPVAERRLEPIAQAAEKMLATLPADSPLRSEAEELRRRVAAQQWVAEAVAVRDAEPVPAQDLPDLGPGHVKDPLERFQAVGYLRWEKSLLGPGRYVIVKGGQPLYVVSCDSGRYDLALFVDMEVGVTGPRRRPAAESLRLLDVEKIEVLAAR